VTKLFVGARCARWVLLLALAALAGCGRSEQQAPQRPPPEVSVMTVTPRTVPYVVTFVAQTESSQQVEIVARVSGFLDKIAYQEGDLVKRGQVLFQLDPKPFQAQGARFGAAGARAGCGPLRDADRRRCEAACRFASATGKRAAIGALAELGKIVAGEAGTTVSPKESGIVYAA
jgi:multidrug efflux pump subunit AcrA (membrane-fusion protein)